MIEEIIAKANRGEPLSQDEERILLDDFAQGMVHLKEAMVSIMQNIRR